MGTQAPEETLKSLRFIYIFPSFLLICSIRLYKR